MTLADQQASKERAQRKEIGTKSGHRRHAMVEVGCDYHCGAGCGASIRTFAIESFYIPSLSMYPALHEGDKVLVNKLSYDFLGIHVGDVVVFRRPPRDTDTDVDDLIKRVVALGGETMYVNNCAIYINGKEEAQSWLPKGWQNATSPYCTTWDNEPGMLNLLNPYLVPEGDVFVMGDNRTGSYDSRYWGPLSDSYIVGRAVLRFWPLGRVGSL